MKRTLGIIALSLTAAFIVLGQTGCGDKANAANDLKHVDKPVNGGKNTKEQGAATVSDPT